MRWDLVSSERIRVLAPAKVNLYLAVGPRRDDGFHGIDSVFQAITLHDEIELERTDDGRICLAEEGIGEGEKNIVVKAARRLREAYRPGGRDGVRIRLRKRIPQGAGLGGGSSDAAATLLALARLWGIPAEPRSLTALAAELGSDVPFFLVGGTARCRGRGELVESWADVPGADRPFHYVLVYPRINISTKDTYASLDAWRGPGFTLTPPSPLDSMPPVEALSRIRRGQLAFNHFEDVVYRSYPRLAQLRDTLSGEPFVCVLMSGSGSTIYGLAPTIQEAERIAAGLRPRLDADVFVAASELPSSARQETEERSHAGDSASSP